MNGGIVKIRVLLADDHPLVLEGISACLNNSQSIDVIATARDGVEALQLARELLPDVAMLDINMPKLNGLDAIAKFRDALPDTRILVLSMHDNKEYIASAMRQGASGYVLKDVPTMEIVTAIKAIHHGGTYFSSGVTNIFSASLEDGNGGLLTDREETILVKLAEGLSNKDVARDLQISVRTVETHRRNIKRKLGIDSTAGLVRYAVDNGLIKKAGSD